jgi:hypothetical protein
MSPYSELQYVVIEVGVQVEVGVAAGVYKLGWINSSLD